MARMTRILLLAGLGGAIGSSLRAAFGLLLPFPWGDRRGQRPGLLRHRPPGRAAPPCRRAAAPRRAFLVTGVLGGFTTFSAFSLDALRLYEGGA
jgi:CrcB protein